MNPYDIYIYMPGGQDTVAITKDVDPVENKIGSESVRKVLIEDTYHMLTLDRQKGLVAREVITFFKAHSQRFH